MKKFFVGLMIVVFILTFAMSAMADVLIWEEELKAPDRVFYWEGQPLSTDPPQMEVRKPSLKIASHNVIEAVKQSPVSLPDWWSMTIDIAGTMLIEALKTGNLFITIDGVPGGFLDAYQGKNINFVWGTNRVGRYVGVMPAKILPFQENFGIELLRKARPQLLWNYDNGRILLGFAYDFRAT